MAVDPLPANCCSTAENCPEIEASDGSKRDGGHVCPSLFGTKTPVASFRSFRSGRNAVLQSCLVTCTIFIWKAAPGEGASSCTLASDRCSSSLFFFLTPDGIIVNVGGMKGDGRCNCDARTRKGIELLCGIKSIVLCTSVENCCAGMERCAIMGEINIKICNTDA